MNLDDRVIVVTGAGRGIGAALCRRLVAEKPRAIVVCDIDAEAARQVASETGGVAFTCDVAVQADMQQMVSDVVARFARLDVFCSNAGITAKGGEELPDDQWQRIWDVNVMSRIYAARAVIPIMLRQREGYLIHVASAAALLTEVGSAPYSVTKQADLSLAEWLAVRYGREGIRVSCVCPLGVHTDMLDDSDPIHQFLHLHAISADDAAAAIMQGIADERFLILTHPELAEFFRMKNEDQDRWIRGMQRLRQKLAGRTRSTDS